MFVTTNAHVLSSVHHPFLCPHSQVLTPFLRTAEDDAQETAAGKRVVALCSASRMFVSKKAVDLLLETYNKNLRTCVQSLGSTAAYRPFEQIIKNLCAAIARFEPAAVGLRLQRSGNGCAVH